MNNRKPRRYSKKPSYQSKGKNGVSNAVKKYVKKVASKTRPEMKSATILNQVEYLFDSTTIAGSFQWNEFPLLTQGTARDQRIGNEVFLHGQHSKGHFYNNATSPIIIRRLILGYSSGIIIGANAELFDTGTGTPDTLTSLASTLKMHARINKAQFKVYYDKSIKLAPSTSTDGNQTKLHNYFQKFGGKKIKFEGNTFGVNNQDTRFCELYIVNTLDNDSSFVVELTQNSRFYFTDP